MHRNSSAIAVATLALRDTCLSCALPSVTTILIIYPSLQPAISIFAAATAAAAIELKNNVVSHSHLVRFLSLLHHSVHVAVWCAVLPCPYNGSVLYIFIGIYCNSHSAHHTTHRICLYLFCCVLKNPFPCTYDRGYWKIQSAHWMPSHPYVKYVCSLFNVVHSVCVCHCHTDCTHSKCEANVKKKKTKNQQQQRQTTYKIQIYTI